MSDDPDGNNQPYQFATVDSKKMDGNNPGEAG